jgi:protease I
MTMNMLMLIASHGFQEIEYAHTKQELSQAGAHVTVVSDRAGKATSHVGNTVPVADVASVDFTQYDAVVLIGGPGAWEQLNIPTVHQLIQNAARGNKIVAAICIAPRILVAAGVLSGKRATGWDGDGKLAGIFKQYGVTYEQQPVVVDGQFVTASGPAAATDFGKIIIRVLQERTKNT